MEEWLGIADLLKTTLNKGPAEGTKATAATEGWDLPPLETPRNRALQVGTHPGALLEEEEAEGMTLALQTTKKIGLKTKRAARCPVVLKTAPVGSARPVVGDTTNGDTAAATLQLPPEADILHPMPNGLP